MLKSEHHLCQLQVLEALDKQVLVLFGAHHTAHLYISQLRSRKSQQLHYWCSEGRLQQNKTRQVRLINSNLAFTKPLMQTDASVVEVRADNIGVRSYSTSPSHKKPRHRPSKYAFTLGARSKYSRCIRVHSIAYSSYGG
jgi:hypothetical protein